MSDNINIVHFNLMNGGTGPAVIEWFRLKWNGEPTTGPQDFLERCFSRGKPVKTRSIWTDVASGTTLPARDSR